uniref:Uncharacterized protein n=1 Tax=Oryza brachyantha TaxID=4533 RepID=J3L0Z4_ORYBR
MDIAGCCYYAAVHDWFRPPIREEDQVPAYLPIPAMAAVDVDHYLYHQQLQVEFGGSSSSLALPAPATAGGRHDEELLPMVPFSDIDLDAFDDVLRDADELHGSPPAQPQSLHAAVAPAAGGDHGDHFGTRSDASLDMELDATKQRAGPALVGGDQSLSVVVVEGYEMGVRYAAEHKLETTPPKKETPLPLSPPPRVPAAGGRRRRSGRLGWTTSGSRTSGGSSTCPSPGRRGR